MTSDQYRTARTLRDTGRTYKDIAAITGLPVHTVVNVVHGRVKEPGQPRADMGRTKYQHVDQLVERCKEMYMMQGRITGNISACIAAAQDWGVRNSMFVPHATLQRHVYARAKADNWHVLWASRKQMHTAQSVLPKLNYDTWSLVGFNDYWVIDGRKSDTWVLDENGRMFMPMGFYVMELRTAEYLYIDYSRKAHSAREVAKGMLYAALRHGPPRLGILCDNGLEQIGQNNIMMFEAFWPREIIEDYRRGHGIDGFHTIYDGEVSPVVTSLPRIPTEFGKARLERSFSFLQRRFDALTAGTGYQGGGRNDVVHTTLMRAPLRDRTWLSFSDYVGLMTWFLTAPPEDRRADLIPYQGIERPQMFASFTRDTGMRPTIGNALQHCLATHVPGHIPDESYWRIVRSAVQLFERKRVTRIGLVEFTAQGTRYSFACEGLSYDLLGSHVDVALDPQDDTRAGLFVGDRFLGMAADLSRRMNMQRITIASAKEVMGELRKSAVRQLRSATEGYAIAPPHREMLADLPAVGEARAMAFVDEQYKLLDEDDNIEDGLAVASDESVFSNETRELLSRIRGSDGPAASGIYTETSPHNECMESK